MSRPQQKHKLTLLTKQPDGYLTEERKAQDPDQGFSTFFSETGTLTFFPRPPLHAVDGNGSAVC